MPRRGGGEPVAKGSTYVRLDAYADFDAYAAARPPALASQVERKLRRLEADGRGVFHMHGPGELEEVLAWLPDLEAGRLARYPESVLPPGYLRSIVSHGFESGLVRCSVFRIDGKAVSWRIDYRLGGTLYLAECSFDETYSKHSPGQIHTWAILRWHMARGGLVYDTLIGDQAYNTTGPTAPSTGCSGCSSTAAHRPRSCVGTRRGRSARCAGSGTARPPWRARRG